MKRIRKVSDAVIPEAALEAIMALSDEAALMTTDAEHRITMFSPGAEKCFGYSAEEVSGKCIDVLIPHRLRDAYMKRLQAFADSHETFRASYDDPALRMLQKGGEEFPVEAAAAKLRLPDGPVTLIRMRDIGGRVDGIKSLTTMEAIVNLSEEAIVTLDKGLRITGFNPAAERMFGYTAKEIQGHVYEDLIPVDERETRRKRLKGFLKPGMTEATAVGSEALRMLRKDGEEVFALAGISAFFVDGERVIVVRLHDVTEKMKAEELGVRLLAAEERAALKASLLSTVSHELRSPLSAVLGFTSLLIEYDHLIGAEERLQQLKVIEESTRHLQRIVDDLLVLSRLEAGVLEIERKPVSVQSLFDSALMAFRPQSSHTVKLIPRKTHLAVIGDRLRLRQVLSNLVDNAVKYSPAGGEIEIHAHRNHGKVSITVRDHGAGVRTDEMDLIFESFYRGHSASSNDAGNSAGLGLAICKGFIEGQGGEIRAELPEDGGLAVTFTLPLATAAIVTARRR